MKIDHIEANNKRKDFLLTCRGRSLRFPYAKASPKPSAKNPILRVYVDPELAAEGFTYTLRNGEEGTVHIEQVLEYNNDPAYMLELFTYKQMLNINWRMKTLGRRPSLKRQLCP